MKQRILVTGVASIVGARLAERLIADGHAVVGMDDLSSGSWALVRELEREPRFTFREHDVARPFDVDVDAVFHLAVPSSRRRCEEAPIDTTLACVIGTGRVLELGAARDLRVVMATSLERWGEGVRCAESLAVEHVRAKRLDVRLVRVARAFGPAVPLDDDGLVTRLSIQAARGEPLDVGSFPQKPIRLAWVDDAVEALVRAMRHELRLPPFVAPLFETTPDAVAAAVRAGTQPEVQTSFVRASLGATEGSANGASSSRERASLPISLRPTVPEALPASLVLGLEPAMPFEAAIAYAADGIRERLAKALHLAPAVGAASPLRLTRPVALRRAAGR